MFAGVAKDLAKLGGKTVTKLVTPEGRDTRLFRLVSLLTGWKNSLKGVGYFLGSALLEVSYELALAFMMGLSSPCRSPSSAWTRTSAPPRPRTRP